MRKISFVKLGGSLITDKEGYHALDKAVLQRLARETADALIEDPELRLILAHGNGSFGHPEAQAVLERTGGFYDEEGAKQVRAATAELNALVLDALRDVGIEPGALTPHEHLKLTSDTAHPLEGSYEPWANMLASHRVVVTHGAILDKVGGGYDVCSTEELLHGLADIAPKSNEANGHSFEISRALILGRVPGITKDQGKGELIPEIRVSERFSVAPHVTGPQGTDVSGGMRCKLEYGFVDGVDVTIASGLEADNLRNWLRQVPVIGTRLIS